MAVSLAREVVDDFASRVKRAWSDAAYGGLRAELRAMPDGGVELLSALAEHSSEEVRVWAGSVARDELGRDAVPLLVKLASHRQTFTRDAAMQDLAAIDPELLRPFIPAMRRMLQRSRTLYSEGGAAMWRLARLQDRESATTFRTYAARHDDRVYDHRMPMVLAAHLEDPDSIVRRIRAHDHEWMLWLAMAAATLALHGSREALEEGATSHPDPACRSICSRELTRMNGHPTLRDTAQTDSEEP